jgi:hypothetical protein
VKNIVNRSEAGSPSKAPHALIDPGKFWQNGAVNASRIRFAVNT